jgi:hypothetical protein
LRGESVDGCSSPQWWMLGWSPTASVCVFRVLSFAFYCDLECFDFCSSATVWKGKSSPSVCSGPVTESSVTGHTFWFVLWRRIGASNSDLFLL